MSSALAIAAMLVGPMGGACARDGSGLMDFFNQTFGGGDHAQDALPQPDSAEPSSSRPLTVRIRPRHHAAARLARSPKATLATLKDVTIYTDKTLARGDAVMTAHGIRIFNGSASWPYKDEDFVALTASSRISPTVQKELRAMDVASRAEAHN